MLLFARIQSRIIRRLKATPKAVDNCLSLRTLRLSNTSANSTHHAFLKHSQLHSVGTRHGSQRRSACGVSTTRLYPYYTASTLFMSPVYNAILQITALFLPTFRAFCFRSETCVPTPLFYLDISSNSAAQGILPPSSSLLHFIRCSH